MTASPQAAPRPHLANPDENPSFIKGLFQGEIREELVFPFPHLAPDEQESLGAILDTFRAFAASRTLGRASAVFSREAHSRYLWPDDAARSLLPCSSRRHSFVTYSPSPRATTMLGATPSSRPV